MVTAHVIQKKIVSIDSELIELGTSLQNEFEFFLKSDNLSGKPLQSKKNQLAQLKGIEKKTEEIFSDLNTLSELEYKLKACLIFHGVSPAEVDRFTAMSQAKVYEELKAAKQDGYIQIPEKIRPLIDQGENSKRWSDKYPSEPEPRAELSTLPEWVQRINKAVTKAKQDQARVQEPKAIKYADKPLGIEKTKTLIKKND